MLGAAALEHLQHLVDLVEGGGAQEPDLARRGLLSRGPGPGPSRLLRPEAEGAAPAAQGRCVAGDLTPPLQKKALDLTSHCKKALELNPHLQKGRPNIAHQRTLRRNETRFISITPSGDPPRFQGRNKGASPFHYLSFLPFSEKSPANRAGRGEGRGESGSHQEEFVGKDGAGAEGLLDPPEGGKGLGVGRH